MADTHRIAGSERPRSKQAKLIRPVDQKELIGVTLIIRSRADAPPLPDLNYWQNTPPGKRNFYSPEKYTHTFGADPADIILVESYVSGHGMEVQESHPGRKTISVLGTAEQIKKAFGVTLNWYESPVPVAPDRTNTRREIKKSEQPQMQQHFGYDGAVNIPAELKGIVTAVIGLDNRQMGAASGTGDPVLTGTGTTSLLQVPVVAGFYNFPNSGAANQTIGIIAPQKTAGNGASYLASDINNLYFPGLTNNAYRTVPASINDVNLVVGSNTFSNNTANVSAITAASNLGTFPNNYIIETTQDICTAATIAQGANINVYFTEDSEHGWMVFLNRVLLPQGEAQPTVLSLSYFMTAKDDSIGSYSDSGSTAYQMSALFQQLAAVGINVFSASGDWGSDYGVTDGNKHVGYPGSDPWITSCGGTVVGNVQTAVPVTFSEVAWSDSFTTTGSSFGNKTTDFGSSGGGASANFPVPPYQTAAGITQITDSNGNNSTGRFVPDIAGMVGFSGFFVNGITYSFVGTSCVAPLYAGLAAVLQQAFGISLGFLNPSFYQLGNSVFNDITSGDNNSGDTPAAPFYTAGPGWDPCTGWGSLDGNKLLNGIASLMYNQTFYFAAKKDTFGLDEVAVNQSPAVTGDSTYTSVIWLVLEGYTPNNLTGVHIPKVAGALTLLDGVTLTVGAAAPQLTNLPDTPQRIFYPCTLVFSKDAVADTTDGGAFPDVNDPAASYPLSALIKVGGQNYTAAMIFELVAGADPSFANYDDANDNAFYLSQDLRVFTVTPGVNNSPAFGITLAAANNKDFDTDAAYGYIQSLVSLMDIGFNNPGNPDPFASLPDQSNLYSNDSSVTPFSINPADPDGDKFANYNFAVARVRLKDKPNISTNGKVKVFFRLFVTESTDTDYIPSLTYPSVNDAQGHPSSPLLGFGNTTIPFFATGNYEGNDDYAVNIDYSTASVNNKSMNSGPGGEAYSYFGCYLNLYPSKNKINGQEIQSLLAGTHHCIVAQIAYDDAPIAESPGSAVSPENSDKLAQRNLQITLSDNPGPPATHRIPQTFDLRPSFALSASGSGDLLDYPDELMIDWGNTPVGALAHIYWPQVSVTDVLDLAKKIYSTHLLTAADANTVQCKTHNGYTFVPIPPGTGENFAGLFTVDLPPGVLSGQEFTITVRRISTKRGKGDVPGRNFGNIRGTVPVDTTVHIAGAAGPSVTTAAEDVLLKGKLPDLTLEKSKVMRNWRYVVGSFAVRIPVTVKKNMLWPEENTLAIMKWRLAQLTPADRWYPVLVRYIQYISGRIDGLGGNSTKIDPSPYGLVPYHPGTHKPGEHEPGTHKPGEGDPGEYSFPPAYYNKHQHGHTGKVSGLIFDGFGDFEGFILDTLREQISYFSRDREIKLLAERAWREHLRITVRTAHEHSVRPLIIIIHQPPAPF